MNNEFKKSKSNNETRYVLENSATVTTGSVATAPSSLGKVQKRGNILAQEAGKDKVPATTPRNFVAKNAKTSGAGAHKDKKKEQKQGAEKHKKPYMESLRTKIDQLKSRLAEQGVAEAGNKPLEKSRFGTGDTRTPRDIKSQMSGASDEFVKSTADKTTGPFHSKVAKMQGKMAKSELRKREQGVAEGLNENLQADDGEYYSNSDDFFSQFESDWFDKEETSPDGMEIRGYIDGVNVMAWRFKSAKKIGGWGIYDDSALKQGVAEGFPKDPNAPKLVRDRKTGKQYDPNKEFEKKMNSPEVMAQMKRMAQKEGVEDRTSYQVAKILSDRGIKYDPAQENELINAIGMVLVKELNMTPKEARNLISYDEDFVADTMGELRSMEQSLPEVDVYMESLAQSLQQVLSEKAVSKKQQKFMGMVHAAQKGEKPASKEVAKVAKDMGKKDAKDFASTKHKGLPEKKKSKK
jgi:hypothetical protein